MCMKNLQVSFDTQSHSYISKLTKNKKELENLFYNLESTAKFGIM